MSEQELILFRKTIGSPYEEIEIPVVTMSILFLFDGSDATMRDGDCRSCIGRQMIVFDQWVATIVDNDSGSHETSDGIL